MGNQIVAFRAARPVLPDADFIDEIPHSRNPTAAVLHELLVVKGLHAAAHRNFAVFGFHRQAEQFGDVPVGQKNPHPAFEFAIGPVEFENWQDLGDHGATSYRGQCLQKPGAAASFGRRLVCGLAVERKSNYRAVHPAILDRAARGELNPCGNSAQIESRHLKLKPPETEKCVRPAQESGKMCKRPWPAPFDCGKQKKRSW
jgi:hypothetical protein